VVACNPDRILGDRQRAEPFTRPFGRRLDGHTPRFLDFNHDGRVSAADVGPAVQQILLDTAAYLAGFDVVVVPGDVGRNTNLGQRLLHLGYVTGNPTYVVYVGGLDFDTTPEDTKLQLFPTFGASFQAPVGFNLQDDAFTYFTTMAVWYQANRPGATPEQFAQDAALTVVHEFGHLLGLGDTLQGPVTGDDNSIMTRFVAPNRATFPDRVYRDVQWTATGRDAPFLDGPQNPAAEVHASLQGQPAFSTAGLFSSNDRGPGIPFARRPPHSIRAGKTAAPRDGGRPSPLPRETRSVPRPCPCPGRRRRWAGNTAPGAGSRSLVEP
jgi:hypothetical protein